MGIAHPEVIAAQWALESDWGDKVTGKYNYWGVKSGNGDPNNNFPGTVSWTKENLNGKSVRLQQKFKDYDSIEQALEDRHKFTNKKGGRYDKAGYFQATSPAEAALALQRGNYATDPNYADSLIKVMKGVGVDVNNGQQYDYSTTIPNENTAFTPNFNELAAGFVPPTDSVNEEFNQLNHTYQAQEIPQKTHRQQYQKQLAQAFGIQPEVKTGLPDYIGDLVQSIYDQS